MSDGIHGHGALLQVDTTSNFAGTTAIGNIMSINNEQTRDSLDISTMDSTSKFREFITGMIDAGEITLELNYDGSASGNANILGNITSGRIVNTTTNQWWRIKFPDTSTFDCKGYVTSLGFAVPFDDKVTQPVTIKLSGVPIYTDVA